MDVGFRWRVGCVFEIKQYRNVALSVPSIPEGEPFQEKDLSSPHPNIGLGRFTLAEHQDFVGAQGMVRPDAPLLAFGLRNSLVNLRAPVVWRGKAYAVDGERPQESRRAYYGLRLHDGRLSLECATVGERESSSSFFVAGIPVLWDEADDASLLDLILIEAADHSHVFKLPRGRHPRATDAGRRTWSLLHDVFTANVHAAAVEAVAAMRRAVDDCGPGLARCDDYLNAVVGIKPDGTIVWIYAHGQLEALGRVARDCGCRRAVCVENSGSVMPSYLPNGLAGKHVPLLRAPNFRARGRAVLFLELTSAAFEADSCATIGAGPGRR